jgi:hypothetical protein
MLVASAAKDILQVRSELEKKDLCWHDSFEGIRQAKDIIHEKIVERLEVLETGQKVDRAKVYAIVTTISIVIGAAWALFTYFFR